MLNLSVSRTKDIAEYSLQHLIVQQRHFSSMFFFSFSRLVGLFCTYTYGQYRFAAQKRNVSCGGPPYALLDVRDMIRTPLITSSSVFSQQQLLQYSDTYALGDRQKDNCHRSIRLYCLPLAVGIASMVGIELHCTS